MALSKAERNALMERLLKGGLKAADCTFRGLPMRPGLSKQVAVVQAMFDVPTYEITHTPTESEIIITGPSLQGGWTGRRRCGTDPKTGWSAKNWASALAAVEKWASDTAEWEQAPDLWALESARLPDAVANTQFTDAERAEIAKALDEVVQVVTLQFELTGDQVAAIAQSVEDLKQASERIGRKDWKLLFYGGFVSLGLEHAVQPGVMDTMFRLAVAGIGHLFGGGPPTITA